MRPFVVIRQFENADTIARKRLIKDYVMDFAFDAYTQCLFREVFVQLVVLLAAVMFIFLHLPIFMCLSSVPACVILLYVSVYGAYFTKALELSNNPVTTCWVAEAYEPHLMALTSNEKLIDYDIVHESRLQTIDFEVNRMKRRIIATISIDEHRSLPVAGWISHFAISSEVKFDMVAEPLIHHALKHAIHTKMSSVEMVTTECQTELRELLLKIGFDIKQVYHQYILNNNNFRIMKSQMGIDLTKWKLSKDK